MQAIILAAGMGRRLKELTQENTKCMVKVNGEMLIDRMLHQIERKKLSRIVVVVGYQGQKLKDHIETLNISIPVIYVENNIYDKTNNIYSLALARDWLLREDTILFESDLIFEDAVLDALLEDPRDTLTLVDRYESWMDGTCVKLGADDDIEEFIPGKKFNFRERQSYYKTVNLYKFSKNFSEKYYVPFLEAYQKALGENEYYEQVLRVIAMLDEPVIKAKRLEGQRWYEIDNAQDLDIAESMFASDAGEKLKVMQGRYGGYWRYPRLLDFCYLVNPYYPPRKLMDEIKASFSELLTQYPSGMRINSLLGSMNFDIHQENILVGNGAAELIKALMENIKGVTGIVRPSFKEYENRCRKEQTEFMMPGNRDFSYTSKDLEDYFAVKPVQNLILINPDNPSGNYIPKKDVMELVKWTGGRNIRLIVDESFADFAEEQDNTLIEQGILDANRHLYVVKSISKSYGVPGLRLGILVSGDKISVAELKQSMPIWNINSFAEFYMQIAEKYRRDYAVGLAKLRQERTRFAELLKAIDGIRVIPSQANYIMVELTGGMTAKGLTELLLDKYNILVKDLSDKVWGGEYLRIAVRNEEDNDRLLAALCQELIETGGQGSGEATL
ncbi:MAG TPA: aminotransferase [Lachnospiraceae bacterium]|nr:aminotransferase [Lachnospiraceae bacterium]